MPPAFSTVAMRMTPSSSDQPGPFATTACYYARYRKPYPKGLFDLVSQRFRLDGAGRLLDVGCGTGQLAIPLSARFEEVAAIDPSSEMVAEAADLVRKAGLANVKLLVMRGEQISRDLGQFRLAVFGSSLHWMAMDDVLHRCRSVLVPGGGIAVADMRSIWGGTSPWEEAVVATVQRWLGAARRAGSGAFPEPVRRYEDALTDSGFRNVESGCIHCEFDLDIPFIIGHLYSTSYSSRFLLAERAPGFECDLTDALLRLVPSGRFKWRVNVDYLFADKD